jgi:hypothetical protein
MSQRVNIFRGEMFRDETFKSKRRSAQITERNISVCQIQGPPQVRAVIVIAATAARRGGGSGDADRQQGLLLRILSYTHAFHNISSLSRDVQEAILYIILKKSSAVNAAMTAIVLDVACLSALFLCEILR